MDFGDIAQRGLVLLGAGRMGTALLHGWLERGLPPRSVWVQEPAAGEWLLQKKVRVNEDLPERPSVVVVAVKPQVMGEVLPGLSPFGGGPTLFISIAAGTPLATFEAALGENTPVIRAMPNTPAAIGRGISALIGNAAAGDPRIALAETLLSAVGQTVRLANEAQMDAVTALSGSGPAYVFHLIEAMAAAGEAEGLPADLSMQLALATVAGAGALAAKSEAAPDRLRQDVTSPGGTTAAALEVLMDAEQGLPALMRRTIAAAAARSRELSQ